MLWDEKVEAWKNNEVTKALIANIDEAKVELMNKLVYVENDEIFRQIQGLIRAYMDISDIIENGDLKEPKQESTN